MNMNSNSKFKLKINNFNYFYKNSVEIYEDKNIQAFIYQVY